MNVRRGAFTIQVESKPLRVLMLGGNSAPGYRLVDNAKYPTIAADFDRSFARLKAEACDISLEGHGFFFGLEEKRAGRRPFVDPDGYQVSLARAEQAFRKQLEQQQAEPSKEHP